MGKGRGAPAAGRGRRFSWPLGSFSRRRQNLGWGVGSMRGPGELTSRVPEITRSRLSGRPRARPPTVRVTPAPPGLPPYPRLPAPWPPPHSPRGPGRARAATAAAAAPWGTRVPPRPALGPAPPGGCAGALPLPLWLLELSVPISQMGKLSLCSGSSLSVIASKPDPGGLDAIQPLSAALRVLCAF